MKDHGMLKKLGKLIFNKKFKLIILNLTLK